MAPKRLQATGRSEAAQTGQLQTLHRALDLMESLAEEGEGALSALSERLGLARSTTHRLLVTLAARGYVRQDAVTGRYRVGIRSFEIGSAFSAQHPFQELARPRLRALGHRFDETVALAVSDGDEAVYIDVVEASRPPRTFARVGARVPLYCTGVGKALLLGFRPAELERYVRLKPLRPVTRATLLSAGALLDDLEQARRLGYVQDREEYCLGIRCLAAPVRDGDGQVVASLSLSAPVERITDGTCPPMAAALILTARELSHALGWQEPRRKVRRG